MPPSSNQVIYTAHAIYHTTDSGRNAENFSKQTGKESRCDAALDRRHDLLAYTQHFIMWVELRASNRWSSTDGV